MRSEGFTLLEFVIVIIIVGILSIIAVPVYRNYIEKTKQAQNIFDVKESAAENIPCGVVERRTVMAKYNVQVQTDKGVKTISSDKPIGQNIIDKVKSDNSVKKSPGRCF